jgi:processing peptidase subunit beta
MGSGSRHETLETSGVAFLTCNMIDRGSHSLSAHDVNSRIEDIGARGHHTHEREFTTHGITSFKGDVSKTVALLGDIVCNTAFSEEEFQLVKEETEQIHEASHKKQKQVLMENVHFNAFRDHMMGQPIRGDRDNLKNITLDQVKEFHRNHYYGDNVIIVVVGDVEHQQIVDLAEQNFSSLPKTATVEKTGQEQAVYNPGLLMIRDDEMYNANTGVFYDAPGFKHPDYYSFLLLEHIFGSYRIDRNAEHLNDVQKQYNTMQALIGNLPDVTMQDSHFLPYSDSGIFGNYFFGNEIFVRQMNYCGVHVPTIYSHYMTDVEVFRGRNHLYNSLMNEKDGRSTVDEIGSQLFHLGRRVPRSEVAKRVAHLDSRHMRLLANHWFYDAEPSFTNWGPIELVSSVGSYKYFKVNTMSTVTNAHHSLYN